MSVKSSGKFSVDIDLIKKLTSAFGVSGCEFEVRDLISNEIADCCDNVVTDKIGNLIAHKKSNNPNSKTVMLMANMDEPGFIVSRVKEGGGAFLDFGAVGKIRPHTVMSESVIVGENKVNGVISLKAVHLTTKEEREKPIKLSDLFIDIGASDKHEADKMVAVGDYAGFKSDFKLLGENSICDKAAASRACCAVMIELLKNFSGCCNLICVFTAQKEVGARGSMIDFKEYTGITPDCCIVLDSIEDDMAKLGDGTVMPSIINQTMADKGLADEIKALCKSENRCVLKATDSDIKSVSIAYEGMLCAEIDLPAKNLNTSAVIVDMRDVNAMGEILSEFIAD